jgi:hypothetical protein
MARSKKIRGAGDAISKVTKAIGIKECDGCVARKDVLNLASMFPFKKVVKMGEDDKEWFALFLQRLNPKQLNNEDALYLLSIYERTFFKKIEPCNTCGGVYASIVKQLTKLYYYEN